MLNFYETGTDISADENSRRSIWNSVRKAINHLLQLAVEVRLDVHVEIKVSNPDEIITKSEKVVQNKEWESWRRRGVRVQKRRRWQRSCAVRQVHTCRIASGWKCS